jgi:hypothetical protein
MNTGFRSVKEAWNSNCKDRQARRQHEAGRRPGVSLRRVPHRPFILLAVEKYLLELRVPGRRHDGPRREFAVRLSAENRYDSFAVVSISLRSCRIGG